MYIVIIVSFYLLIFPVTMIGRVGSIDPYNESEEDFDSYVSRIKMYFVANDISDEKRVPAFFTLAGPKVFKLARDLLSPSKPEEGTFDRVLEVLRKHYKPKPVLIYERYKFYSRVQKSGESVNDFVAALKSLAHTCEFGATLTEMLRDRFVMGLANEKIQQVLLAETELTFDKAVNMATARETASKDVKAMASGTVHYVPSTQSGSKKIQLSSSSKVQSNNSKGKAQNLPDSPCLGCGMLHWKRDCPYKNAKCYGCKQKGHIRKMCNAKSNSKPPRKPQSKNSNNSSNVNFANCDKVPTECDVDPIYEFVFSVRENVSDDPIVVDVTLNSVRVPMEMDTGATCSLIPRSRYEQLWPEASTRPFLDASNTVVKAYGGTPLKVVGEINVAARLDSGSSVESTRVVVVDGKGPCLMGRVLMRRLGLLSDVQSLSTEPANVTSILKEYPDLFSEGLGCYKGHQFAIEVDPTVPPKFCKARPVPYALRAKVDHEIDRLLQEGIISPVTNSPWAAPVVPVLKPNGSIRLCGDYKLTVNRAARLDTYPIPSLDDLFSGLAGGKVFSKLDMSQAYAQLCLDESSKKYTVLNTHRGLFQYNRLSFGVSSAPGIFQRSMEQLLRGIPGVFLYLDDILVQGANDAEHFERLRLVLSTMQDAGLRLSIKKCSIAVPSIAYLGYKIDKEGIHPTKEKIQAIAEAPAPTNVTGLRSFLGLLNFYRRFLPQAASMLEPLNRLLRAKVPWVWGEEQQKAFRKCKETLLNSGALVHFDPALPLVVVADSSSYGVGAVLCHKIEGEERPICFASRTLTSSERNYSQFEKEGLAIVYALRHFHNYLWGQSNFEVITDHKPLLGIFSPDRAIPPMSSGRIQRWALILQAYKFVLRHRSGALLGTADALSRLPLTSPTGSTPVPADWTNLVCFLDSSPIDCSDIKEHTRKDPTLSKVMRFCEMGWPANTKTLNDPDLIPYVRRKEELSLQDGCILWGSRVVVPPKLRSRLMEELHMDHSGASRMKELARGYVWWPNLDKELEGLANSCAECLALRAMPPKAELHPWEWPERPWHRLHVDYAGPVDGRYFLVIVDAHSKWVDVYVTNGTSAKETIRCMQHSYSRFGLPVSVVSDNGPCFTSQEFRDFCANSGVRHITTAVYKPSTNGLAEKMVQTLKKALRTSKSAIQDTLDRFLFNYRLTPHSTTGVSPAELMFGRRLRSRLDLLWPADSVASRVSRKQLSQRRSHSGSSRSVDLSPGSPVMIRDYTPGGSKWSPSTVVSQTGPLSYKCSTPSGRVVKRHQDQVISRSVPVPASAPTDPVPPPLLCPVSSPAKSPASEVVPSSSSDSPDVVVPPAVTSPSAAVRRSSRVKRPVVKLDL